MQEFVSIGMPVFNDKQFLAPALDSLLAQSHEHFELIISDDGSTDGSEAVCREYAARDPRIRYIRQPANLGISRNMMFLLREARGEFFLWAADDDLWHRDYIRVLLSALQRDAGAISAFTPMYFVDEHGEQIADRPLRSIDYSAPTAYQRIKKLIRAFDDGFGYGLFRRDAIVDVQFPVWWWINKRRAGNNIYPTLCFYLAKGNFVLAGDEPLFHKRLKDDEFSNHVVPYRDTFIRRHFAFVLWKLNLVAVSLKQIARAGKGWTAIRLFPSMLLWWALVPVGRTLSYSVVKRWRNTA
jgi:glycosyltransferase involved in cell wall biosynthesis